MDAIVTVDWLKENLSDPRLIILDASPASNASGLKPPHTGLQIVGARKFEVKKNFTDKENPVPNMVPPVEQFQLECQKLGINKDSIVVVYDDLGVYMSPRVYWMFRLMGFMAVGVLNGGLPSWIASGGQPEAIPTVPPKYPIGNFKANFDKEFLINKEELLAQLEEPQYTIVDARSSGRFHAQSPEPRPELRGGHIPGSFNIPYGSLLDNYQFKTAEAIREITANIPSDKPLVYSCGSGITACIVMMAMQKIYSLPMKVYDGSWSEWGVPGETPVEVS